jgi:hypothetical protein
MITFASLTVVPPAVASTTSEENPINAGAR